MDLETFDRIVYQNWTQHFGCPVTTVQQSGTTFVYEEQYRGNKSLALWYIGKHTFVQLDPELIEPLKRVLEQLPTGASLRGDDLERAWGSDRIVLRDMNLIHYLYPADLPDYSPPESFTLRSLTLEDSELMSVFRNANPPEEAEGTYVEVNQEIAYGCFKDDQLVAASSAYKRTGFLDVGVLTLPEYRRLGLGKAAAGAVCEWSIARGIVPQYRNDVNNLGSQGVAMSLNFRTYFKQESVWLKDGAGLG